MVVRIEIKELVPEYHMIGDDKKTNTTPHALYARQDSVIIFNAFADRFSCYVDEYGRLVCCEKENEDANGN